MAQLDSDLLRTFLAICDTGSVSGGAGRIGRSQSATSLQIKQLEATVGRPLFRRHGRGVALTEAGEHLVPVARNVTASLDTVLADLRGEQLEGKLRIGIPDYYGRTVLARIVAAFASRHPHVELQVRCASGALFGKALQAGALDMAVFENPDPDQGDDVLQESMLVWMRSPEHDLSTSDVLPVALFDQDCWWRNVALADLEATGRQYRVIFTSESTVGVHAAVRAGIAAAMLNVQEDPKDLVPLAGMAGRRPSYLVLRTARNADGDICAAMRDAIQRAFPFNP